MALLLFGKVLLIGFMMLVMGAPLAYFTKRDKQWQNTPANQRTDALWYRS